MSEPLVQFLLARFDEEQDAAQRAADEVAELNGIIDKEALPWRAWSRPAASLSSSGPIAEFIDHQTPERALAEIKAKRKIVESYLALSPEGKQGLYRSGLACALRWLADPYAGHEDFRWD
jgi:hypothetical protein